MKAPDSPVGFRPNVENEKRISRDEMYIRMSGVAALRSTCLRKKVGAVITKDHRLVSTGYAGAPKHQPHCLDEGCIIDPITRGCSRTKHAEWNAIQDAIDRGIDLRGATIYCTISPCMVCARRIHEVGIAEIVYYGEYRDRSALDWLHTVEGGAIAWSFPKVYNLLIEELEELK